MIEKFIKKHHVMTLAVGSPPWCAAVFYAWTGTTFVYASGLETRHAQIALAGASNTDGAAGGDGIVGALGTPAAANILLESKVIGRLQGLQIEGSTRRTSDAAHRKAYLKRFPFAVAMQLELWVLEPTHMKLTDNRLGFGKKLIWNKE